jgi:ubiquinone/menaquinone biosynthesis C-methylase UbiE
MTKSDDAKLAQSAAVVGAPWAESPYYDDAEKWSFIFWNDETPFRQLFNRLNLTAVLEISCGHGRHSERVARMTRGLTLLDVHDANLAYCRNRLASYPFIQYVRGDGYSLEPIEGSSMTAIFCYDSMVHFSPDIVENYLRESARVLKPGGMALFHHSNHPAPTDRHYGLNPHARNHMTKRLFAAYAQNAGLDVVDSLIISWGGLDGLDCISLVRRPV